MEITDMNEAEVVSYRYDPYGAVTITVGGTPQGSDPLGNPWMYTGRFTDEETGLYYYRARYYSPVTGRFLQRDPLGHRPGANLYEYVASSPLVYLDPRGLDKVYCLNKVKARLVADCATVQKDYDKDIDEAERIYKSKAQGFRRFYGGVARSAKELDQVITIAIKIAKKGRGGGVIGSMHAVDSGMKGDWAYILSAYLAAYDAAWADAVRRARDAELRCRTGVKHCLACWAASDSDAHVAIADFVDTGIASATNARARPPTSATVSCRCTLTKRSELADDPREVPHPRSP